METRSDEQVASAVQAGDAEAFGVLIDRYENKLKRYGHKFLSQKEDIEDLVQDVFIKAYTNIQSFDVALKFSPWIYRIAHNTFVNELRRQSKFGYRIFDADTVLPFLLARETTDEAVLSQEQEEEIERGLADLSTKLREVIVLHYFEGLSYHEISEVLQIPVTTVGVRMTRARSALKKIITAHI